MGEGHFRQMKYRVKLEIDSSGIGTVPTSWSKRGLLLHLRLWLGARSRKVIVDALVVVVNSYRQHFLCIGLSNNVLIQVGIDLKDNLVTLYIKHDAVIMHQDLYDPLIMSNNHPDYHILFKSLYVYWIERDRGTIAEIAVGRIQTHAAVVYYMCTRGSIIDC